MKEQIRVAGMSCEHCVQSIEEALKQIREKKYAFALEGYTGEKFAVGISWDKKTKEHKIKIEDID